jgi:hypothetical protein
VITSRQILRILYVTALLLAPVPIINLALHGWLGAILEEAALFLSLALAVNPAVYGWLGALGAYSAKEAKRKERLIYLLIAGIFTVMAAATWYALSFEVRPFE